MNVPRIAQREGGMGKEDEMTKSQKHGGAPSPFFHSLRRGDLGHAAILGPTSAGKSTLLATLIAEHFRRRKSCVPRGVRNGRGG